MKTYDVITFDCYGTLIDWDRGIVEAFVAAAAEDGFSIAPGDVLKAYAEIEPVVEAEPYRSYRDVLTVSAARVAASLRWPLKVDHAAFLADRLPSWSPYPDTNPALRRLAQGGFRLGILSNVDDDLLADTLRHLDTPFELLVTAQRVGSYKPAHAHFLAARAQIGARSRWLHAARSYFHDVVPAKALGIPVAWINRKNEVAGGAGPPDYEFRNLIELVEWLERRG